MRATVRTLLCLIGFLVALPVTIAGADAVYPSQHIPLHPVGSAPLRTGFVENIHANGPNVYAHEVYVVVGAVPMSSYDVTIAVYMQDLACSTTPLQIHTATLTTDAGGSGRADVFFSPADADGLRGASHGAIWSLSVSGAPMYQTYGSIACGVPIVGPSTGSGSAFVFIDEAAEDRSAGYPCVRGVIGRLVGSWRSQMLAAVGSACVVVADIFAEQRS